MTKISFHSMKYALILSIIIACSKTENSVNQIQPEKENRTLSPQKDNFESSLPIIIIETNGREIPNEPKIPALMKIIDNKGQTNKLIHSPDFPFFSIAIELRGASSLKFPKKQFSIELRDEKDKDIKKSLLNLPENEDWVLYAPYSDKSLMRNHISYWLSREMGFQAPRTKFVELFLNEEAGGQIEEQYWGVYLLIEKNNRGKGRVEITQLGKQNNSEPEISGGYILNLDRPSRINDCIYSPVPNGRHPCFRLKYPRYDRATPQQKEWIVNYIKKFEESLKTHNNYQQYIDVSSFINGMLVAELIKNQDSFRHSTYFYKDRNKKLTLGPLWDCNLTFGNVHYDKKMNPTEWCLDDAERINAKTLPFWWQRLLEDKRFFNALVARWREMRTQHIISAERIIKKVEETENILRKVQVRNFKRWPILGTRVRFNPEPFAKTWQEEVSRMKKWIETRVKWIDDNIDKYNLRTIRRSD